MSDKPVGRWRVADKLREHLALAHRRLSEALEAERAAAAVALDQATEAVEQQWRRAEEFRRERDEARRIAETWRREAFKGSDPTVYQRVFPFPWEREDEEVIRAANAERPDYRQGFHDLFGFLANLPSEVDGE